MKKTIAIITDIHGNRPALEAVLKEIDENNQIDHIYCLGDLIGIGYQTNEVLEILFSRDDISFVMGNHDEAILDIIAGREPYSKENERKHHEWLASHLDPRFVPLLQALPPTLEVVINRLRLLFVHYHLNTQGDFIKVDYQPSEDKLDDHYRQSDANIVCFGHHHVIHHFKSNDRYYLNPSSLGCCHKPFAPYALLTIGDHAETQVTFKEVPYDNKEFILGYLQRNVPDSDYILKTFHGNQHLNYQ